MRSRPYIGIFAIVAAAFVVWAPHAPGGVQPASAAQTRSAPANHKQVTAATPTPTPTASPKSVVISVAVFRSGVTKLNNDPFKALSDQIAGLGPFQPFVVDDKCPYASCSLGNVPIYIYAKRTPADDTNANGSLVYTSYFVSRSTVQSIATVAVSIDDKGNAAALGDPEAKSLIGGLTFDENFQLSINLPDSEQTLQLVPAPVNAQDPDYEPILEHILETRGVAAQRSRFTANALHGPRDATTCPGSQRYLVYRVRFDQYPHKLQGYTDLQAYAEGFVLDCTAPAFVPSATGQNGMKVRQTAGFLNEFAALLVALKPKIQTVAMTGGISSFSKLVDVDPNGKDVQTTVAANALDLMANNLCYRLDVYAGASPSPEPKATPTAVPTPSPTPNPASTPIPKASPIVHVPLQCQSWARRQATAPPKATPLQAPKTFADGWFDAQMGTKPTPTRTP